MEAWRGRGGGVAGSWWRRRGRGGGVGVVVEASGSWWRRGRGGVGVVVASGSWWRRRRRGWEKAASGVAPSLGSGRFNTYEKFRV